MKVFISHSSNDKRFVRLLKECLLENSIPIWVDEDELDYGDTLISKLDVALSESSHLVIVLSPSSIISDWVQFELKKALDNNRTGLLNKIIPVKYRECVIPEPLSDLLYADLSKEVVLPDGDKVKFISNGFENFFLKLVRAVKTPTKAISTTEKSEILNTIKSTEEEINQHSQSIHRGNYKLKGYSTIDSRKKYQQIVAKAIGWQDAINELRPVLLPPAVKLTFRPNIGDKINLEDESISTSYGHFAGFRSDDLAITVDKRIRAELQIKSNQFYQIEIDPERTLIKFVVRINNPPV